MKIMAHFTTLVSCQLRMWWYTSRFSSCFTKGNNFCDFLFVSLGDRTQSKTDLRLTLLHSERPKLSIILAFLSAIGLYTILAFLSAIGLCTILAFLSAIGFYTILAFLSAKGLYTILAFLSAKGLKKTMLLQERRMSFHFIVDPSWGMGQNRKLRGFSGGV